MLRQTAGRIATRWSNTPVMLLAGSSHTGGRQRNPGHAGEPNSLSVIATAETGVVLRGSISVYNTNARVPVDAMDGGDSQV